ncbi:MAG: alpha-L-arabinofuranosidase [Chthoniobacterales bacterium]|nr:alpha-L-arabinofuranosidase [Chthoniobacterales bacterium]
MFFLRLFALSMLVVPLATRALSDDQIVYDDARQNGWQDYGWATINYANTNPVHSGSDSISAIDPGTSYQALYLHHAAQSTALYQSLRFWVYVTTGNPQPLAVQATRNGTAQVAFALTNLTLNGWTQVTIPLANLGVANVTDFDGFWIQNDTGAPQTWYVDDIALVGVPAPNPITITVDAASVIRTIDGRIYGVNTAIWDGELASVASGSLLATIDTQLLRFPGGSASDDYDWQTDRSVSNGSFQWVNSAATFATVAAARGAQTVITANYGSGTPEEAAAWVAYYNSTASSTTTIGVDSKGRDWQTAGYWAAIRSASPLGTDDGYNFLRIAHPAPLGFKYWEIGNECYGDWEYDLHGASGSGLSGVPHDPYTYAQFFASFYPKMLAIDSTIRIGAVGIPGEDSYGNGTHAVPNPNENNTLHSGWTPVVLANLKLLGITPHFLIHHSYVQQPGGESDSGLLQASSSAASDAANLRTMITDYVGAGGSAIELQMTELNSVSTNPGKQTVSLVNGLYFADLLGQLARTEFNACTWWDYREGSSTSGNNSPSLYGWRLFGNYGIVASGDRSDTPLNTPYPSFYAAKLMTHWGRGGDQVVSASTNYPLIAAHAALLANGDLALLVINKSATTDFTPRITLKHFVPGSTSASEFSYGKANDLADGDLSVSTLSQIARRFRTKFPAYSMTVIVLPKP